MAGNANVGADEVRKPHRCHIRGLHVTSAARRLGHPHPHRVPLSYKERHVVVTTCGELYKKWRAEGRLGYKRAPDTGAVVPLTFVHTGMDRAEHKERGERPLVLLFTGSPGDYHDFSYTIPFLDRHGADVVCFNWPDFSFTMKTGYWWHSSEEKAHLALGFLKELDINVGAKKFALNTKPVDWMLRNMYGLSVLMPFAKLTMKLTRHPLKPNMKDVAFAYLSTVSIDDARASPAR